MDAAEALRSHDEPTSSGKTDGEDDHRPYAWNEELQMMYQEHEIVIYRFLVAHIRNGVSDESLAEAIATKVLVDGKQWWARHPGADDTTYRLALLKLARHELIDYWRTNGKPARIALRSGEEQIAPDNDDESEDDDCTRIAKAILTPSNGQALPDPEFMERLLSFLTEPNSRIRR
jgi:DNA-directed RNA polymerase specialized sigma24 family protein